MNNSRRKIIAAIINKIDLISEEMEVILNDIENVKDEEEEVLDSIPENLQGSERYSITEESVDNLNTAFDMWQEAFDNIEEIKSALEEAAN